MGGWRLLLFEVFAAFSLSVTYYFLIGNFAVGVPNNTTNGWASTSCSIPAFHLGQLGDEWKGRLSGLLLSGWLFDFLVRPDYSFNVDQFFRLFGLYQSVWLFLLFLVVILGLRHSLFINLGIFAGLMYNFTPTSGLYFYPWDVPATFFFTLAVIFFEYRRLSLMMVTICIGCFFKETVLVCALLVLFAAHWKWRARLISFGAMIAVYALGKKLLLAHLNFHVAAFSMSNATDWGGLLQPTKLVGNLETIFSLSLNHPIFANAGTLAAVLLLGWRRRFLPYMTVILASFVGLLVYGGFNETRDFMQLLPVSLILLSERWQDWVGSGAAGKSSDGPVSALAKRETFPVLVPLVVVVMGLSTGIAASRYYVIYEDLKPEHRAQSEIGKHLVKPEGHFINLELESQRWREGYADAELELALIAMKNRQFADATNHFCQALDLNTNSVPALVNYSWLLATAADPYYRNGDRAVRLAERACQLTQYQEPFALESLAAACAEAGRFSDAVAIADKARAVAAAKGQTNLVTLTGRLLELYQSHRPYHLAAEPAP